MPEASRTDKLAISAGFSVTLSPPPDLAVSGVQAPAQDFSGQPMKVSWTVANNGTGPTVASAWTDAVYMSSDRDPRLERHPARYVCSSGGAGRRRQLHQQRNRHPAGGRERLVLLPGQNGPERPGVREWRDSQQRGRHVRGRDREPDAAARPGRERRSSPPATALAGHGFTFSYTVTNAGAGATPNYTWNDSFYLSPTATFKPATAISLGQQTHQGSLDAGAAYTNTVTATLPNGLARIVLPCRRHRQRQRRLRAGQGEQRGRLNQRGPGFRGPGRSGGLRRQRAGRGAARLGDPGQLDRRQSTARATRASLLAGQRLYRHRHHA